MSAVRFLRWMAKSNFLLLASGGVSAVSTILAIYILHRAGSFAGYGKYAYGLAIGNIACMADNGIGSLAPQLASLVEGEWKFVRKHIKRGFITYFGLTSLSVFALFLMKWFGPYELAGAITAGMGAFLNLIYGLLLGRPTSFSAAAIRIVAAGVTVLMALSEIAIDKLFFPEYVWFVGYLIASLIGLYILISEKRSRTKNHIIANLAPIGRHLMINQISDAIIFQGPRLIIGVMIGPSSVGIYDAASRIVSAIRTPAVSYIGRLPALLIRLTEEQARISCKIYDRTLAAIIVISSIVGLFLGVRVLRIILNVTSPVEFNVILFVSTMLIISNAVHLATGVSTSYLQTVGHEKIISQVALMGAVFYAVSSFICAHYGIEAVSVAMVVSLGIPTAFLWYRSRGMPSSNRLHTYLAVLLVCSLSLEQLFLKESNFWMVSCAEMLMYLILFILNLRYERGLVISGKLSSSNSLNADI